MEVCCSSPVTVTNAARDSQQVLVTALGGCLTHNIASTLCVNHDWSLNGAIPEHHPSHCAMTRHMLLLYSSQATCNAGIAAVQQLYRAAQPPEQLISV